MMTTTGFVTADYALFGLLYSDAPVMLMIVGGCAGSTSGAVKCVRLQIVGVSGGTQAFPYIRMPLWLCAWAKAYRRFPKWPFRRLLLSYCTC